PMLATSLKWRGIAIPKKHLSPVFETNLIVGRCRLLADGRHVRLAAAGESFRENFGELLHLGFSQEFRMSTRNRTDGEPAFDHPRPDRQRVANSAPANLGSNEGRMPVV